MGKILLLATLLLSACSTVYEKQPEKDGAPPVVLNPATLNDAVPRFEVIGRAGNRTPYEVNGKTYHLLPSPVGYVAEGTASWYGTKFHGQKTSNGETFSMFDMSAAHKTLPIPCFAKVTNLENGLTTIVRINDRGPFYSDRLIDLSYAAATKLGYVKQGTARVRVEVIDPYSLKEGDHSGYYLQIGAFSEAQRAEKMLSDTRKKLDAQGLVEKEAGVFRVKLGPIADFATAEKLLNTLITMGISKPVLIRPQ